MSTIGTGEPDSAASRRMWLSAGEGGQDTSFAHNEQRDTASSIVPGVLHASVDREPTVEFELVAEDLTAIADEATHNKAFFFTTGTQGEWED
jgi:hypothetical protein